MSNDTALLWIGTDDDAAPKKFMIVDFEAKQARSQVIEDLSDGQLSVSSGRVRTHKKYTLLVPVAVVIPEGETETDEGCYADLKAFHALRNPNGTPSNILELTDFEGEYLGRWLGDCSGTPAGILVEGAGAYVLVDAEFVCVV